MMIQQNGRHCFNVQAALQKGDGPNSTGRASLKPMGPILLHWAQHIGTHTTTMNISPAAAAGISIGCEPVDELHLGPFHLPPNIPR